MEESKTITMPYEAMVQWQDCIANFDFEKMHKIMEFLDWTWYSSNGVPDVDHIKDTAMKQLYRCYVGWHENKFASGEQYYSDGGGLLASYAYFDDEDIEDEKARHGFNLRFVAVTSF